MGTWTLQSVRAEVSDFDTGELFGSNVKAFYRMNYRPSKFQKFKEPPHLNWLETIMMNEHHKGEQWVFQTNMYAHNPNSKTLEVWPQRYLRAYKAAHGQPSASKGYSKLLDKNGAPVKRDKLGTKNTSAEQADAVRQYLNSNGGTLEIQIHDIPSINIPKPQDDTHKERLLLFDCGVIGGGPTFRAYQYLVVKAGTPKAQWTRKAGLGWGVSRLVTTGLKQVQPPIQVSRKRDALFVSGECM